MVSTIVYRNGTSVSVLGQKPKHTLAAGVWALQVNHNRSDVEKHWEVQTDRRQTVALRRCKGGQRISLRLSASVRSGRAMKENLLFHAWLCHKNATERAEISATHR